VDCKGKFSSQKVGRSDAQLPLFPGYNQNFENTQNSASTCYKLKKIFNQSILLL
jgi:hypothetical protein